MSRDKYKYVLVEKDIHDKIKLYSEVTGMKIYKITSEAIKEYIENHPVVDNKTEFKELKGVKI
jgi:hypothetical protein